MITRLEYRQNVSGEDTNHRKCRPAGSRARNEHGYPFVAVDASSDGSKHIGRDSDVPGEPAGDATLKALRVDGFNDDRYE